MSLTTSKTHSNFNSLLFNESESTVEENQALRQSESGTTSWVTNIFENHDIPATTAALISASDGESEKKMSKNFKKKKVSFAKAKQKKKKKKNNNKCRGGKKTSSAKQSKPALSRINCASNEPEPSTYLTAGPFSSKTLCLDNTKIKKKNNVKKRIKPKNKTQKNKTEKNKVSSPSIYINNNHQIYINSTKLLQ